MTSLADVSCPTATQCVAGGQGESGTTPVAVVLATTDGGRQWQLRGSPAGAVLVSAVRCPGPAECQVLATDGLNIWSASTADGGATWQRGGNLPAGLSAPGHLSCPDVEHCAVAGYTPTTPGQAAGAIATTADGGATWVAATLPTGTGLLHAVSCPTDTACVASGTTVTADIAVTKGAGLLLSTADGGQTWTADSVPARLGDGFAISCPSMASCVVVGARWLATTPPTLTGAAVATTTAGRRWRPPSTRYLPAALTAVDCATTSACVAVGGEETAQLTVPAPAAPRTPAPPPPHGAFGR